MTDGAAEVIGPVVLDVDVDAVAIGYENKKDKNGFDFFQKNITQRFSIFTVDFSKLWSNIIIIPYNE